MSPNGTQRASIGKAIAPTPLIIVVTNPNILKLQKASNVGHLPYNQRLPICTRTIVKMRCGLVELSQPVRPPIRDLRQLQDLLTADTSSSVGHKLRSKETSVSAVYDAVTRCSFSVRKRTEGIYPHRHFLLGRSHLYPWIPLLLAKHCCWPIVARPFRDTVPVSKQSRLGGATLRSPHRQPELLCFGSWNIVSLFTSTTHAAVDLPPSRLPQ